jgi:hypothetical protein
MIGLLYIVFAAILILILTTIETSRNFIGRYLSEFLTAIAGIGLTLVDIMSGSEEIFVASYTWNDAWAYLLTFFSIILLSAIIIAAKRNKHNVSLKEAVTKNNRLQREIELYREEYYKLCSTNILYLFERFFVTGNERISIYIHQGNHFTLLGRYSKNPQHNKRTTYQYKDNEGLIGKAWNEGELILVGAPKWVKTGKEYKKFMKERCTISDQRLRDIRMKSQSLYIKTLDDKNTPENPDGIIVFESISPIKVDKTECAQMISDNEVAILSLLKNMKSLTKKVT